jgi:hypothetical protein
MMSRDQMLDDARAVAAAITDGRLGGTDSIARSIFKFAFLQAQYERLACQAIALQYGGPHGNAIADEISKRHPADLDDLLR